MSGKNRAFAIAIATAALVGFSAPMALAATIAGPANTGFNGDSIVNLSNNQIPVQTCTGGVQSNLSTAAQAVTSILGVVASPTTSTGDTTPTQSSGCAQTPTQTNTAVTDTTSSSSSHSRSRSHSSDPSNSGFNGDSIVNVSGNQIPVQTCTGGVQTNAATAVQAATAALFGFIGSPALTTGALNPSNTSTCAQTPTNTNESALNS